MKFKGKQVQKEFEEAPRKLKEIAFAFEKLSQMFGIDPLVTRVKEKIEGSSGVHEDGRALDFRDEYAGTFTYTQEQREVIMRFLELMYPRTDAKKLIIWHSFNGGPRHFHLQVMHEWCK